jgi:putative ABC transport system ATP-binding protein
MLRPQLLLADEPTASLDDAHAHATLDLLRDEADRAGALLLVATHDARVRSRLPVALELGASALAPPLP